MIDSVIGFLSSHGYLGIFAMMALENVFPPIPSEVIMPLAGFLAASGQLHPIGVVAAGTAGSIIGTLPWYVAGKLYGKERLKSLARRHGRWVTIADKDIDKAMESFSKHGNKAVFFGRLIPAVRTLISAPAGICGMRLWPFLLYSAAGSLLWSGVLAAAGYLLEDKYRTVAEYLDPVSKAIVAVLAAGYLYRVATFRRHAGDGES